MSFFINPQIHYLVLLPEDINSPPFTFLHGFSESLLRRSSWIRTILENGPATVHEAFGFSLRNLELRIACISPYSIGFLKASKLPHVRPSLSQPFWIILADEQTEHHATDWAAGSDTSALIAIAKKEGDSIKHNLNTNEIQTYIQRVIGGLDRDIASNCRLDQLLHRTSTLKPFVVECERTHHNVTLPNELTLRSMGGEFSGTAKPLCGDDKVYLRHIAETANFVDKIRLQVKPCELLKVSPVGPGTILVCPAMYKFAAAMRPPKGGGRHPLFRMLRMLQRQTTYSVQFEDKAEAEELLKEESSVWLLMQRTLESSAYTDAVSARAASYVCPVLRLPPRVNHVHPKLKMLRDCLASHRPTRRKVRKVTEKLETALQESVPSELIEIIDRDQPAVKLISDFPLEWLPLRGLPLALRHVVSRIPATPGNLSFQQTLPREQLELTLDAFSEILVIRSFQEDDPLRRHLETAVGHYRLSNGESLPVRIQDVRNSSEFLDAVNGFHGAMMIYDGHGTHGQDEIATLSLTEGEVNCWDLAQKMRCPPIVFACGCDTHRAEGSHVTTANAFLKAGAMSVIASAMPIYSDRASIFVGRLLFNILEHVRPIITEAGSSIRFDRVFSSIQKMMYVSDLIWRIAPAVGVKIDGLHNLHVETNLSILSGDYDWFEQFLERCGKRLGSQAAGISILAREVLPFAECLKYFHLGNPDLVVITPKDVSAFINTNSAMPDKHSCSN